MEHVDTATFREESRAWILDGYSCEIRYLAHKEESRNVLFAASVTFSWQTKLESQEFHKDASNLVAGVIRMDGLPGNDLREILELALRGKVNAQGVILSLDGGLLECRRTPHLLGVTPERNAELLQCKMVPAVQGLQMSESWHRIFTPTLDVELGRHEPFFDGFDHLCHSLELPDPRLGNISAHVEIVIEPPVIFDMQRSHWDGDWLRLAILAHGTIRWNAVSLMGRDGWKKVRGPMRPFGEIEWTASGEDKQSAWSCTSFPDARDVITVLKVGGVVASRQSFSHPSRASNDRYLVMEKCDKNLEKLKEFLFSPAKQSRIFESAVAALLFLRGFNPALSMDTNSADIVVITPAGRWLVVECSTSLDDARKKAGKLFRRREEIRETLKEARHSPEVVALLVCVLPGKQIAKSGDSLRRMQIQLWSKEDLEGEWSQVRQLGDADKTLAEIAKSLSDAAELNMPPQDGGDLAVVDI